MTVAISEISAGLRTPLVERFVNKGWASRDPDADRPWGGWAADIVALITWVLKLTYMYLFSL